jgi:type II secretory pathway pseudopilin PulG
MKERDLDRRRGEQGFMLLAMVVAIFLVLVALSVAAPRMARELRREREVEAVHRGNQYVRALQLYYRKMTVYPGSMEQLEKSNNVRFLRRKYMDPMTGKADWRIIHVGEAKTTVKGFFGEPLMGLATSGVGTGAVTASPGMGGAAAGTGGIGPTSTLGSSSAGGIGSGSGAGSGSGGTLGSTSPTVGSGGAAAGGSYAGASGATGTTGTGTGAGSGTGNGLGLTQSSGMPSGGAPFMGVGLPVEGDSIIVLNEQASYPKWEFIYDPRIEQLKKNSSLFGGASAGNSQGTGALAPSAGMGGVGSPGTNTGTGMNTGAFGSTTNSGSTGSNAPVGSGSGLVTPGSGASGSGATPPPAPPAPQQ